MDADLQPMVSWLCTYAQHVRAFYGSYTPPRRLHMTIDRSATHPVVPTTRADALRAAIDAQRAVQDTCPSPLNALVHSSDLVSRIKSSLTPPDAPLADWMVWSAYSNTCIRLAALVADEYFNEIQMPASDQALAEDFVRWAVLDTIPQTLLIAVTSIDLSDSGAQSHQIEDGITLQAITDDNRESWINEPLYDIGEHVALTPGGVMALETAVRLDWRVKRDKPEDNPEASIRHRSQLLMGLLNCLWSERVPDIAVAFESPESAMAASPRIRGQRYVRWQGLRIRPEVKPTRTEIERLHSLWGNVTSRASFAVALEQFALVPHAREPIQKLLHMLIALEALFRIQEGEKSYRLALRAASWYGTTPEARVAARKTVKTAYSLRSRYVHGNTMNDKDIWGAIHATWPIAAGSLTAALENPLRFNPEKLEDELLAGVKPSETPPSQASPNSAT